MAGVAVSKSRGADVTAVACRYRRGVGGCCALRDRPSVALSPSRRSMTNHPLSRRSLVLRSPAGEHGHAQSFGYAVVPVGRPTRM